MLPTRRSERRIAEQKERNVTLWGTGKQCKIKKKLTIPQKDYLKISIQF